VPVIRRRVLGGSTVYADEAPHWDALHADYAAKRINHTLAFSDDGACTNQAESFFSRLRRAEIGQHHHIAARTSSSTRARWAGARTTGAGTTGRSGSWPAWRRSATRQPELVRVLAAARHVEARDWTDVRKRYVRLDITSLA
jgi:hypothetical protein